MKKMLHLCMAFVLLALAGGCGENRADEDHGVRIVYGSRDYDQINPLRNEYGVIDQLLFDGVMRRDATGATVPGLAASYEYDPETYTYVFRLRDDVFWHDGKPLRAADVKFTIEAIQNPLTGSFNAQNFEDVREITELDDKTVRIRLSAPNTAFLDYMVQSILPAHLLAGRDLRTTGFFHNFARIEIVHAVAEQLCAAGIHCTVETPAQIDWGGQMAYLVGWGSPLDADVHTYKVFATNGKVNVGRYSNARVDEYLMAARRTSNPDERMRLYGLFQEELAKDPPYVFLCYIDAVYVANARIHGIAEDNLLGHRAIGFFGNVNEWTVE